MDFEELIETLSKGSATAVTTLESNVAELNALKEYLYVQTPVEQALRAEIDKNLKTPRVIFVCGSSGDGKSELFRRIHTSYAKKVRFHLDATHSFDPQKDAIQTLDDQFSAFKAGSQSLVVGINIGMLGNYAADGDPTHSDIKSAISTYLESTASEDLACSFVDFRNYPKFRITAQHLDAQFIGQLLERLVTSEPNNPFFVAYQRTNPESQVARNFYLLQIAEVREKVLDVLLHAHLRYDQFLTARTVLDFVYRILTGDGYLFDNIFRLSGSDLLDALQKLDPCTMRSKRLDLFRIRTKLELFVYETVRIRVVYPATFPIRNQSPVVYLESHRDRWKNVANSHIESDWKLCLFVPGESGIDFAEDDALKKLFGVIHTFLLKERIYQRRLAKAQRTGEIAEWPGPDRSHGVEGIREAIRDMGRAGRNDPCPCGSGLKFKKCPLGQL